MAWHTTQSKVRWFPVTVINTRPDVETADALARHDLRGVGRRRFAGIGNVPMGWREPLVIVSSFTLPR